MRRRQEEIPVNYLYFGFFFIILIFCSGSGILIKDQVSGSRIFFFLYASGQAALETLLLLCLCWGSRRYTWKPASFFCIGATFLCLILHLLDFIMDRILDLSIWETIGFVLDESFENFLYLLDASGIPLWGWLCMFTLLAALPFIGILFYEWMFKLSYKRAIHFRKEWCLQAFLCIPAALLFWEFTAARMIHPDSYTAFLTSLPWKWTFLQPRTVKLPISSTLATPHNEKMMMSAIAHDDTVLASKPNIYLFVIESFREDFITTETAPNFIRFKQEATHFDLALSNANGSHLSWFSIFHSQFPYCWRHLQENQWSTGSPALQLLKKWGYKIRLYTSAQLNYYNMDHLLFGKERSLIDSYQTFHHVSEITAAQTDQNALQKLQIDLREHPDWNEGQVFIIFWDSTHFNYSWPKDWETKFLPISKEIDYFNIFQSPKKIEMIKNRYRNAVFYVDSLFGQFMDFLPNPENAIVITTGDHGEEFFERGHLFHGSHLTHQQTNIPLYMKFGTRIPKTVPKLVSQMDIFPSLLHHLSGHEIPFLEGQSIFSHNRWPYAVVARFNAGRTPYEFCVHNGEHKLIARFNKKKDVFGSESLTIRSIWNRDDQCLIECQEAIEDWVQSEFGPAIDRLFQVHNSQ